MAAITSPGLSVLGTNTSSPAARAASFPKRRTLGRADRVVVRAIAEAMFSQDGEVESARLDAHVADVDALVSAASKPLRIGLRLALFVVRIAPVLLFYRLARLEKLPVDERVHVLDRLERSKLAGLSLAFIGWRTVMTIIFYEDPSELAALGYTTNERTRHKRALPLMQPVAQLVTHVDESGPVPIVRPGSVPVPEESGVRLRGHEHEHEDRDSDHGHDQHAHDQHAHQQNAHEQQGREVA